MAKRVIVGLDGSEFSEAVLHCAADETRADAGIVIGVAIVDEPGIAARERASRAGAGAYAKQARETLLAESRKEAQARLSRFQAHCRSEDIAHEAILDEGCPYKILGRYGRAADFAVTGARTYFHAETEVGPGDTIDKLVQECICPIRVVPEVYVRPDRVLIAYDGSPESSRAMRAFTMLTPVERRRDLPVRLVHAYTRAPTCPLDEPIEYLQAYFRDADLLTAEGRPAEVILHEATDAALIVLGGYAHGRLHHAIFGSVTKTLIKDKRHQLFLFR